MGGRDSRRQKEAHRVLGLDGEDWDGAGDVEATWRRRAAGRAGGRDPRVVADATVYAAEGTTAPDGCSEEVVQVSQVIAGSLPNGIPCYSVTVTNTCLACTVRDVHVSCGNFASTELVDPSNFRRLAYADCLVKDGEPIGPGETVSFEYSNSFIYNMDVASVSCGDV
ncbi:TPD1 protein-like protein 1B [Dichanthelium oligosanthes]|uniref:TPD1 protein-like protein 1B n=1 Tax=Dichanthelium oligosanthes TaxID=888268 RepID=A0A1E5UY74_9POAL|nr:TPD1 protein-like protein 1B [Dichanthelium oligosanthes]